MKRIILATILTVVMLAGCTSTPTITDSHTPTVTEPTVVIEPALADNDTATTTEPVTEAEPVEPEPSDISEFLPTDEPINPRTRIEYEHIDKMESPLNAGFGISEQCSLVGVYPGYSERVPLLIRNGNDRERLFVIHVVSSTKPKEGFEALPEEYLHWLTVEEPEIKLDRNEYCWINILIAVPKDSDYSGKHAEVRIRIDDITQTGFTRVALESIWYITTAE